MNANEFLDSDMEVVTLGNKKAYVHPDLAEPLRNANAAMMLEEGEGLDVTSSYRSPKHQAELYLDAKQGGMPVAVPGSSKHNLGAAVDIGNYQKAKRYLEQAGFLNNIKGDPVHFYMSPRSAAERFLDEPEGPGMAPSIFQNSETGEVMGLPDVQKNPALGAKLIPPPTWVDPKTGETGKGISPGLAREQATALPEDPQDPGWVRPLTAMIAGGATGAATGTAAAPFLGPFAPLAPAAGAILGGATGFLGARGELGDPREKTLGIPTGDFKQALYGYSQFAGFPGQVAEDVLFNKKDPIQIGTEMGQEVGKAIPFVGENPAEEWQERPYTSLLNVATAAFLGVGGARGAWRAAIGDNPAFKERRMKKYMMKEWDLTKVQAEEAMAWLKGSQDWDVMDPPKEVIDKIKAVKNKERAAANEPFRDPVLKAREDYQNEKLEELQKKEYNPGKKETPEQFIERINRYAEKWSKQVGQELEAYEVKPGVMGLRIKKGEAAPGPEVGTPSKEPKPPESILDKAEEGTETPEEAPKESTIFGPAEGESYDTWRENETIGWMKERGIEPTPEAIAYYKYIGEGGDPRTYWNEKARQESPKLDDHLKTEEGLREMSKTPQDDPTPIPESPPEDMRPQGDVHRSKFANVISQFLPKEQVDVVTDVMDAFARTWAKTEKSTPEELWRKLANKVAYINKDARWDPIEPLPSFVYRAREGEDISRGTHQVFGTTSHTTSPNLPPEFGFFTFFKGADAYTVLHEFAHGVKVFLGNKDLNTIESWLGVKDGKWSRQHHELWADSLPVFLREGKAPTPRMVPIMQKLVTWLKGAMEKFVKRQWPVLNDSMRTLWAQLLGREEAPPVESVKTKVELAKEAGERARENSILKAMESGEEIRSTKAGLKVKGVKGIIDDDISRMVDKGILKYDKKLGEYTYGDKYEEDYLESEERKAGEEFDKQHSFEEPKPGNIPGREYYPEKYNSPQEAFKAIQKLIQETGVAWGKDKFPDGSYRIYKYKDEADALSMEEERPNIEREKFDEEFDSHWRTDPLAVPASRQVGDRVKEILACIKDYPDHIVRVLNAPKNIKGESYLKAEAIVRHMFSRKDTGVLEGIFLAEDLIKEVPEAERKMFLSVMAGHTKLDKLSAPAQQWYSDIQKLMYSIRKEFQSYGRLKAFYRNYLPTMILADKNGNPVDSMIPLIKRKDPFVSALDYLAQGYKVELDPAVFLPKYLSYAFSKLGKLEAWKAYRQILGPDGVPLIRPKSYLPRGVEKGNWIKLKMTAELRGWDSPIDYEDPKITEMMKNKANEVLYAHRDIYQSINGMFYDPSEAAMGLWADYQNLLRQVIMYNPMFHGWNLIMEQMNSLGPFDLVKSLTTGIPELSTEQGTRNVMRRAVGAGMRLEGLYDVRKMFADRYQNVLEAREKYKVSDLWHRPLDMILHPLQSVGDLNTTIVFDNMLKKMQLVQYVVKEGRYLKEGLSPSSAAKVAAMDANNVMGTLQPYNFTRSQRNFLRIFMFARDWNVATMRQLLGTSEWLASQSWLPKFLRTEGLSKAEWHAIKHENRMYILRSVIGAVATGSMIQMAMQAANGKDPVPIFKNEYGHWFDIDTGTNDEHGNPVYWRNPLSRFLDDHLRAWIYPSAGLAFGLHHLGENPIDVAVRKVEPLTGTTVRILLNKSGKPGGKAMRGEEAGFTPLESLLNVAKEIFTLMPFDDIYGQPNKTETWWERGALLLGTTARHGISRTPGITQMVMDYHFYLGRRDRLSREAKEEISHLRAKGQNKEANEKIVNYMKAGYITKGELGGLIKKQEAPILSMIISTGGKLNPHFRDFLQSVPEAKRKQYEKDIQEFREELPEKRVGQSLEK